MLCNNLFNLTYKANILPIKLLHTLLGNSQVPVEQGNPNTCAEVKLCLFFISFSSRLDSRLSISAPRRKVPACLTTV